MMSMRTAATPQRPNRSIAVQTLVLLPLFILAFVLFTYTFLHESGHALVGLLFGQTLTEFNVNFLNLDAYVGMAGSLTQSQLAIQSVAGAGLPLLIWFVFIRLAPRKAGFSLEVLKLVGTMTVLNTLLAWMILPILYLFGKAPPDDVTNFLRYSQMPPLLLIVAAIVLYGLGWALFLSKIDGLRKEFLLFRTTDRETLTAGTRTTVPVMASLMAACIVLTFTLNGPVAGNAPARFSPPQDFVPVAQIELSTQAYSDETLATFSLDTPAYVGVFIAVRNINTTYFDLSVIGPDGYRSTVLHGEGYSADQDGGLWEENLSPGIYQVVLKSHPSPGTASSYLKPP